MPYLIYILAFYIYKSQYFLNINFIIFISQKKKKKKKELLRIII